MVEKLVSTVHTFVGKRSNTLRSRWRSGRDDHLDAAGVVAGQLLGALELSSESASAAVVRRRQSCPTLPPARTATVKPPPIDDQNYGGSAGVVAAMLRCGLVRTAGGLRGEEAAGE